MPEPTCHSSFFQPMRVSRVGIALMCAWMFLATAAVADIEFVEPPPVDGPVPPYRSGTVLTEEENRRLAREQRDNWQEVEQRIDKAEAIEKIREKEVLQATAGERAAADEKVDGYADQNEINGTTQVTVTQTDVDGHYEAIEIHYAGRSGMVEYKAKFDGAGNLMSPVTQTPSGKAAQNSRAMTPAHATGTATWHETTDQFGNSFPHRVDFPSGSGYLLFNERGIAYQGELFNVDGMRIGAFLEPREYPAYGDPDGDLSTVNLASHATSTCPDCQDKVLAHNNIADEFNHISREMNQLAERHNRADAINKEHKAYGRDVIEMRARYAHLSGVRAGKQAEGSEALNALLECDTQCPGKEADDPVSVFIGSPIAGPAIPLDNPFQPIFGPMRAPDAGAPVGESTTPMSGGKTCSESAAMSVPADTIACSVHTRKKPDLGQTSNPNVEVTGTTAVPEEAGGGYDSEVKIHRSPDDNNLRQGCGDLPEDLISMGNDVGSADDSDSVADSTSSGREIFNAVSCNQVAKNGSRPPARITVRDHAKAGTPEGYLAGKRWGRKGRDDHPDERVTDAREAFKLMKGLACGSGTGGPALPKTRVRFSDDAGPLSEHINLGTLGGADIDSILHGVEVGQAGLNTLTKLEYLKDRIKNGMNVTAEDIGDLADSLDTLRGDRFAELGNVLGAVSKHAGDIKKAGEVLEQAGKIYDWIQLAEEGRDDPLKAAEAFSQYLGMLSEVAGKVPGMGEFVSKYAEAVASIQDDLKIIDARTKLTNEIIEQVGTFRDQYPELELDDFYEDIAEGYSDPAVDGKRETDLRNRDEKVADEREALTDARDTLRRIEDCIKRNTAKIRSIELAMPDLEKAWDNLPDQDALEREIRNSAERLANRRKFERDGYPRPGDRKSRRSSARWTNDELAEIIETGSNAIDHAIRNARDGRVNREYLTRKAKNMRDAYEAALKALEDCGKRLEDAQRDYLQALRDYQSEYAYWTTFIDNNYNQAAAEAARASALSAVDEQVTALGMGVIDGRVTITVTTVCEEDGTVLSRETTTQVGSGDDEMSDEEFTRRFGQDAPDGSGYQDDGEAPDLSEFDAGMK